MPSAGSQALVRYVVESTFDTTPAAGVWETLRHTGETLRGLPNTVESGEIISNRQITDDILTNVEIAGDISFELSYGTFDSLLESVFYNAWSTNVLKVGNTRQSFTFEKEFTDFASGNEFLQFKGVVADGMTMVFPGSGDKRVTGTFNMLGATALVPVTTSLVGGGSTTAATATSIMTGGSNFTVDQIDSTALPSGMCINQITLNLQNQPTIATEASCDPPHPNEPSRTILLAHGSGGQLGHELVEQVFLRHFSNPTLSELNDSALLDISRFTLHSSHSTPRLAFTTDSYVISPLFFPGGDIGKLSVCGTVNDLAVTGAEPRYLSAGFIIEEGLPWETLERVVASMAATAIAAGVQIVTGDTKVVNHGAADGLFINTAGVGFVPPGRELGPSQLRPGDRILVSGTIGDHGMAVMMRREGLELDSPLVSDCAPLNALIADLLAACPNGVRCMRDPTRGGMVATLNEWAGDSELGLVVEETAIPLRQEVRGACEILGLDPLYVANEGKVVLAVAPEYADAALNALRAHPLGREAALIGHVTADHPSRAVLRTPLGARRLLDMLVGEQLPRIC